MRPRSVDLIIHWQQQHHISEYSLPEMQLSAQSNVLCTIRWLSIQQACNTIIHASDVIHVLEQLWSLILECVPHNNKKQTNY